MSAGVLLAMGPGGVAERAERPPFALLAALACVAAGAAALGSSDAPIAVSDAALRTVGLLAAAGLLSGFLAGLLGIGGALVTLPVLYATLATLGIEPGQVPATAVATALVAMVPTTLVAAWTHHRRGAIDLGWLGRLVVPMSVGAALGALAARWIDSPLLGVAFALQGAHYGVTLLLQREAAPRPGPAAAAWMRPLPHWLAGTGIAAFCASVGMGCGSMLPRSLQRRGVEFRAAVATGSALNLCVAVGGSLAFFAVSRLAGGTVGAGACWTAGLVLGAAAVVAAPFGVATAHELGVANLRRGVAAVNLVAAWLLVAQICA